jgi:5-keto 4-deoxyuronate isomerase
MGILAGSPYRYTSLTLLYKIINEKVAINPLSDVLPKHRHTRRSHAQNFINMMATKDVYKYTFLPHRIREWNTLSQEVVTAPTVDAFHCGVGALAHKPD